MWSLDINKVTEKMSAQIQPNQMSHFVKSIYSHLSTTTSQNFWPAQAGIQTLFGPLSEVCPCISKVPRRSNWIQSWCWTKMHWSSECAHVICGFFSVTFIFSISKLLVSSFPNFGTSGISGTSETFQGPLHCLHALKSTLAISSISHSFYEPQLSWTFPTAYVLQSNGSLRLLLKDYQLDKPDRWRTYLRPSAFTFCFLSSSSKELIMFLR